MVTSSNGNIFRVTGPLCSEFTCQRWIPHTKASGAESEVFFNRSHYGVIVITHMHYFCETNQLTQKKPRDWRPLCSICNVICLIAVNDKYTTHMIAVMVVSPVSEYFCCWWFSLFIPRPSETTMQVVNSHIRGSQQEVTNWFHALICFWFKHQMITLIWSRSWY